MKRRVLVAAVIGSAAWMATSSTQAYAFGGKFRSGSHGAAFDLGFGFHLIGFSDLIDDQR